MRCPPTSAPRSRQRTCTRRSPATCCRRAWSRSPSTVSDRPLPSLVGVVVLTQGRRPAELEHAVRSILVQEDVDTDVVVVGNGWAPSGLPDGVRGVSLPENVGIPAGRN